MNPKQREFSIKEFEFEGKEQLVSFVETMHVADGVDCDVYTFVGDPNKDLGIIKISSGSKTPLQRVLKGDQTIEGYISGKGKLTITKQNGKKETYIADEKTKEPIIVTVNVGSTMQWEADKKSSLTAYEICFPPYEDGRYENLTED